ncbi:M16 family metallopeptidase [Mesonia aquimarina]|uniref:M16 family metallopeptidase n=1 Tax=Mesonia aquimarina TaxID=1504967 RepID=UPI000EF63208|nr:insulinase family protein [Mesonia aquimarina]
MKTDDNFLKSFCFILLVVLKFVSYGQAPMKEKVLPVDPSILHGQLPNGLTYYIKPLDEPTSDLVMNFWVKAGIMQQGVNQPDLAHFLEHMAFKASTHFPKGLKADSLHLAKAGIRNLKDIHASSGYYNTNYHFAATSGNPEAVHTALLWFKDIAHGLKLTDEDIDNERGVLLQEFNTRVQNLSEHRAKSKMLQHINPCFSSSDNFFDYNAHFPATELREFYNTWYRPDLMAIGVVGNIEHPEQLKAKIEHMFGGIPMPKKPKPLPACELTGQPPSWINITQGEKKTTQVKNNRNQFYLGFRDPSTQEKIHRLEGLKQLFLWQSMTQLLQNRLNKLQQSYDIHFNFLNKHTYRSQVVMSFKAHNALIDFEEGHGEKALETFISYLHQLKEFGVHPEEWEEVVKNQHLILDYQDTTSTKYWSKEIYRHFVAGEALPAQKKTLLKQWWNKMSLTQFNQELKKLIQLVPEDIAVIATKGSAAANYTEVQVRKLIHKTLQEPVKPYFPKTWDEPLISKEIKASLLPQRIKAKGITKSGGKRFSFENGAQLIFHKDTTARFKGKIEIEGFSPWGSHCFSYPIIYAAQNAANIVHQSGMSSWDKFDLDRFIANQPRPFAIKPYIEANESGIQGKASAETLEEWLQMMYLYMTHPRYDAKAFDYWKRQKKIEYFKSPYDVSFFNFKNRVDEYMGRNSYENVGEKLWTGIKQTNLDTAFQSYQQLFGQTHDFTFVVRGNIEEPQLLLLAQKYIGNLPQSTAKFTCKPISNKKNKAQKYPILNNIGDTIENSEKTQYLIRYVLPDIPPNSQEYLGLQMLSRMLGERLMDLRYQKNFSIYGVSAPFNALPQSQSYDFSFYMGCKAKELSSIRQEAKNIIEDIKLGNIDKEEFKAAQSFVIRMASTNTAYQNRLLSYYKGERPWVSFERIETMVNTITPKLLKKIAKRYVKEKYLYEFATYE